MSEAKALLQNILKVIKKQLNISRTRTDGLPALENILEKMANTSQNESLYEFEGEKYDSYAKPCLARGLIKSNDEYIKIMEEACHTKQPSRIRNLSALLLMYCNRPAPEELWDIFKEKVSEDFKLRYEIKVDEDAWNFAYAIIVLKLFNNGKNMELDFPSMSKIDLEKIAKQKEKMDQSARLKVVEKMELQMNNAQKEIFLKVKDLLTNGNGTDKKSFFIDGPGGTGKTFVYKAIYHLAISMNKKIENTAFSGIAITLLPKGKTNHNLFKLPVAINQDSISRIELNSVEGKRLRDCDIIAWDEAPMAPKYALEICNNILQQLMDTDFWWKDNFTWW